MISHNFQKFRFLLTIIIFGSSILLGCARTIDADIANEVTKQVDAPHPENLADCIDFQRSIEKTYTFKPSKLNASERTEKSGEMDLVWEKVKSNKNLIPCLKSALNKPGANSFFLFDGSNLLISLDRSEESKKLLISSFAKTDLEDVDRHNWIAYILMFGFEGLDTSAAGDTWLRTTDPFYFLPQHGTLRIDKMIGALAIYGSMDEQFATPSLAAIINQKNHPGREIAAGILVKQVTPEAADALSKVALSGLSSNTNSEIRNYLEKPSFIQPRMGPVKISREQYIKAFQELAEGRPEEFMNLVDKVSDGEKDAIVVLRPEDIPLVRKARRFFASTGTPHVPEWYQTFTDILMVMVRKPQIIQKTTED